jgi:hypothetical protein
MIACARLLRLSTPMLLLVLAGCADSGPTCGAVSAGPGTPSIELTSVPPIGSTANLKGQVLHVAPTNYFVAVYIYVPNGGGWWIKPYFTSPDTMLNCGGTFSAEIVTGGEDADATIITAFVLPSGYSPPLLDGAATLPQSLYSAAVATATANR